MAEYADEDMATVRNPESLTVSAVHVGQAAQHFSFDIHAVCNRDAEPPPEADTPHEVFHTPAPTDSQKDEDKRRADRQTAAHQTTAQKMRKYLRQGKGVLPR